MSNVTGMLSSLARTSFSILIIIIFVIDGKQKMGSRTHKECWKRARDMQSVETLFSVGGRNHLFVSVNE